MSKRCTSYTLRDRRCKLKCMNNNDKCYIHSKKDELSDNESSDDEDYTELEGIYESIDDIFNTFTKHDDKINESNNNIEKIDDRLCDINEKFIEYNDKFNDNDEKIIEYDENFIDLYERITEFDKKIKIIENQLTEINDKLSLLIDQRMKNKDPNKSFFINFMKNIISIIFMMTLFIVFVKTY